MKTRYLQSAGGVLVGLVADVPYTVVLHRRNPDEWRLPKGKLRGAETPRQAAIREVEEETGIAAEASDLLGQIEYEYVEPQTNETVHKQVVFYLMPLAQQLPIKIESEAFDQGLWVQMAEAERLLTFAAERRIVREARGRLAY